MRRDRCTPKAVPDGDEENERPYYSRSAVNLPFISRGSRYNRTIGTISNDTATTGPACAVLIDVKMFPCTPEMVLDLKRSLEDQQQESALLCKKIRNACLGSAKRKDRFVQYGLVPVLFDVISRPAPEAANDALITLGSLVMTQSTARHVLEADENQQFLWEYVLSPNSVQTAESAARVLRLLILNKPQVVESAFKDVGQIISLLKSKLESVSRLGARCVIACCCLPPPPRGLSSSSLSARLGINREVAEILGANHNRSEDDALALASLTWRRLVDFKGPPRIDDSVGSRHSLKKTTLIPAEPSPPPSQQVSQFWCRALNFDSELTPNDFSLPGPKDCNAPRTDGADVLRWTMAALVQSEKSSLAVATKAPEMTVGEIRDSIAWIKGMTELMGTESIAIKREIATAIVVFCFSRPCHAVLVSEAVPVLLEALFADKYVENTRFGLAALLSVTSYRDGALAVSSRESFDRFAGARKCLQCLLGNDIARARLDSIMDAREGTEPDCIRGILRLFRHLSACEESTMQLVDSLNVHPRFVDAIIHTNNSDARVGLSNLLSISEKVATFVVTHDAFLRLVCTQAMDHNDQLYWAILTNLAASRSLDTKKRLVAALNLPRLVSERGLPVLRNLCSGKLEDAALIEPVIVPTLTFIASGMEPGTSLEIPVAFLVNVSAMTETCKAAVCNDPRVLQTISTALDAASPSVRFSAVRCLMNLVSPAPEAPAASGDETSSTASSSTSPRSPLLRIVHARVMAAASRSPIRFGSSSPTSSSVSSQASSLVTAASRQVKLNGAGFLLKLQGIAADDEDESVRALAAEVVQVLST